MLNKNETKQLVAFLKKIDFPHEGLPQPVFDALCGVVPFVSCELVLADKNGRVLLTWRNDKWWRGWHFPGGLFRYRENFEERIEKVAWEELGIRIKSFKFLFIQDCSQGKRGHVVSLVFLCKTDMKPNCGKFFKQAPSNIINVHREIWAKLEKFLN